MVNFNSYVKLPEGSMGLNQELARFRCHQTWPAGKSPLKMAGGL